DFRWYVLLIQCLHLVNTLLVWLLLRRLSLPPLASAAGALFFVFHMALFDAMWKPMFLFDVYCGLFCLLSMLSYLNRRWLLSFLFFWLAYKSKEHAVMLPAVLFAFEHWLGERNWRRLIPFLAVSALFGLQAVFSNHEIGRDYNLSLSPASLMATGGFYANHVLVFPWLWLLLPAAAWWIRDRRLWFSLAGFFLLMVPMLALPNRTFGAYLYAPIAFLTIAAATVAARADWAVLLAVFALWLPANYGVLKQNRKAAIAISHENRAYVDRLRALPKEMPDIRSFIYDGYPPGLKWWGIQGALRYFYDGDVKLHSVEDKNLSAIFESGPLALLSWDNPRRTLSVLSRAPGDPDVSYIEMARLMPVWQLGEGWYGVEGGYRWTRPRASARLHRPAGARQFELYVNVGPQYIRDVRLSRVHVLLDGREIGVAEYARHGWRRTTFDVTDAPAGPVRVELRVEPEYRPSKTDPRVLGIAVGGFGFPKQERQ
ncbi:MAG: hypothetical protein JJE04_07520, partial [Acidobacteriia bacterium]|nr:hypothetical protein [Terriglobia bacterium]